MADSPTPVRAALLAVSCDLPAARKLCGFMAPGASAGCSRCDRQFDTETDCNLMPHTVYSGHGFDTAQWPRRTNANHRAGARSEQTASNPTEAQRIASRTGARWSILLELSYFDAPRMTILDPMHTLYLGVVKSVMKRFLDDGDISLKDLELMQQEISASSTPRRIGRIPGKIANRFAYLKASEWKTFGTLFASCALRDRLESEKYDTTKNAQVMDSITRP